MFVGEIGITRHEFLYDILFWEANRIVRGYYKRGRIFMQLLAENVFASTFAFRGSEGKTVKDMFPQLFESDEQDDEDYEPPISQQDADELRRMMQEMNEKAGIK